MDNKENKNYTFLDNFRYERKFRPETLGLNQIHNIILSSSVFFLPNFTLDKDFTTNKCHELLKSADLPIEILDEIAGMELKLFTRYNITYFKEIGGRFRLTTDSDITYYKTQDNFNRFIDFNTDKEVVIEIKYDKEHNVAAAGVSNEMPFRLTRNSKFIDGISKLYEVPL
ncbi:MAG: hypothetical protein PHW82_05780 [Bacteroidales bacterium]|nr:hypothetical protein [Bacteroidales bacterium]